MEKRTKNILTGVVFISLGIAAIVYVWFENSKSSIRNWTFSPYTMLQASWDNYKNNFINQDGRVIDSSMENITTSEGQSYAMLRSVWIDDKEIFDRVWNFTKNNLQKNDKLFGWKWGEINDKEYGFLSDGGENSATDADTDIALSLLLAANRWRDHRYREEAEQIVNAIWDEQTAIVANKRYIIAGTWADTSNSVIINPSYFSPYAYRYFAMVDEKHNWEEVIDSGYEMLNLVTSDSLDTGTSALLPPDWVEISKISGKPQPPSANNFSTNYSYDAIRVPWRIALDYTWNQEERAKSYLNNSFAILADNYRDKSILIDRYSHSGEALTSNESPAMYSMALVYFSIEHPGLAEDLYNKKIIEVYSNGTNAFLEELSYYDQNLLWFGAAFYHNRLFKI